MFPVCCVLLLSLPFLQPFFRLLIGYKQSGWLSLEIILRCAYVLQPLIVSFRLYLFLLWPLLKDLTVSASHQLLDLFPFVSDTEPQPRHMQLLAQSLEIASVKAIDIESVRALFLFLFHNVYRVLDMVALYMLLNDFQVYALLCCLFVPSLGRISSLLTHFRLYQLQFR